MLPVMRTVCVRLLEDTSFTRDSGVEKLKFLWVGGPTFLLELGVFRVLADPVFGTGEPAFIFRRHPATGEDNVPVSRLTDLPPLELSGLDIVLVSQHREDHFDAAAAERLDKNVAVIAPTDTVHALSSSGFGKTEELGWWEELSRTKSGETLTVMAVPTRYANDERMRAEYGASNGYIIRHETGDVRYTAYWTADTAWFSGARDISRRAGETDLLIPGLGAIGSGGPHGLASLSCKEAMQFVFLFRPKTIIPIGYNTFSHYEEGVAELEERIGKTMYEKKLVVLGEGQSHGAQR